MSPLTAALPAASATGGVATHSALSANQYQELWDEALRKFREQNQRADKSRRELIDKLLKDLQDRRTPEAIMDVLARLAKKSTSAKDSHTTWANLRDKCLLPAVKVISVLIDVFGDVAASAAPGGKMVFAALGVILKASKWCDEVYDTLSKLFEGLGLSIESLGIRTAASCVGTASKSVAILMLVNLLDVLTLAIKHLPIKGKLWRIKVKAVINKYWDSLIQDDEVKKARERMKELVIFETRAIAAETQVETANIKQDTTKILEHTDTLSQLLARLTQNSSRDMDILISLKASVDKSAKEQEQRILERIDHVDEADLRVQEGVSCLNDTRVDVLEELRSWSSNADAPRIYWLNGMAGTGKSTIARSFGRYLEKESRLGGSFFCSRGDNAVLQDAKLIIPTLARAMSAKDSGYYSALIRVLGLPDVDLRPTAWPLGIQVQNLFQKPFEALAASQRAALASRRLVLIIDALDEASGTSIQNLVEALIALPMLLDLPIKFFLTSRPERHIRTQLGSFTHKSVLHLHDIDQKIITKDIKLYVEHRFETLAKKFPDISLPWRDTGAVQMITALADKLFIYAFTITEYIFDENGSPGLRFKEVLDLCSNDSTAAKSPETLKRLDDIYTVILRSDRGTDREKRLTRRALTAILTVKDPLTVTALAALLNIESPGILRSLLKHLHSVLRIPGASDDTEGTISTFHASFPDFVEDLDRAPSDLWIDTRIGHFDLAIGSARIMGSEELHSSGLNIEINDHRVQLHGYQVPSHVAYAFHNWIYHAEKGTMNYSIQLDIGEVLVVDFTAWTETGRVEDIEAAVEAYRREVGRTVPSDSYTLTMKPVRSPGINVERRSCQSDDDTHASLQALYFVIELVPRNHPAALNILLGIGRLTLHRYERSGRTVDLEQAIVAYRRAFELTRYEEPEHLPRLRYLRQLLHARYMRTGKLASIERVATPHHTIGLYDFSDEFGILWTKTVSDAVTDMSRVDTQSTLRIHVDTAANPDLGILLEGIAREGLGLRDSESSRVSLSLSSRDTAHLSVERGVDGNINFEIRDQQIRELGLDRLNRTVSQDRDSLRSALRSAFRFFYHLRSSPTQKGLSCAISKQITLLEKSVVIQFDIPMPVYMPVGDPISLDAGGVFTPKLPRCSGGHIDRSLYGVDILYKSPIGGFDIFVWIFYFDCSTMEITSFFGPRRHLNKINPHRPDLPAGMQRPLPLNYGDAGVRPLTFEIPKQQTIDVGYLRIFLSTHDADLSAIQQGAIDRRPEGPSDIPRHQNMSELGVWDAITIPVVMKE